LRVGSNPSLPDEADNHLIELAVAGGAEAVVTKNVKHLSKGELQFAGLAIVTPDQLIEE
jgi:predicted nucleic acid-binding protein